MPEDRDAIYQLAYDEAKQAVAQQVGALDNLRGRAGTLLAVASLSTSFLGGIVLQDKAPEGWLSWAAIGACHAAAGCSATAPRSSSRGTRKGSILETWPRRTGIWPSTSKGTRTRTRSGLIACTGYSPWRASCSAERSFCGWSPSSGGNNGERAGQ